MAVGGLLALLDDVTAILDDVAALSKVAAEKTVALAGDDLAVNAQELVGIAPARELPIVGKVALGSFVNKIVLIPIALMLPMSWITPLLMLGGIFLCYEGVHKVLHRDKPADRTHPQAQNEEAQAGSAGRLAALETGKVKQAIITDIVLSAEIIAVSLAAVASEPLAVRAGVLSVVGFAMTLGIYGLVAVIVKMDDIGLHFQAQKDAAWKRMVGVFLVEKTPVFMRCISVGGTFAMFLVGGGIMLHGIPGAEDTLHHALAPLKTAPMLQAALQSLTALLLGVGVGGLATGGIWGLMRLRGPADP